jgi:LmbE family N-acetylglucosaminyl deacetylase
VISLNLARPGERLSLLCLGAHSDDIEIGAGGVILSLVAARVQLDVQWCVASAIGEREAEARASAAAFFSDATPRLQLGTFRDGYLPYQGGEVKEWLASLAETNPDLVLTHRREDAHQDHRFLSELTSQVFRDSLILEYETPKWDGDLGQPNFYFPLTADILERKIALLEKNFGSQRSKDWFDEGTFRGLARLRGMECRAPERYAEAFVVRKAVGKVS